MRALFCNSSTTISEIGSLIAKYWSGSLVNCKTESDNLEAFSSFQDFHLTSRVNQRREFQWVGWMNHCWLRPLHCHQNPAGHCKQSYHQCIGGSFVCLCMVTYLTLLLPYCTTSQAGLTLTGLQSWHKWYWQSSRVTVANSYNCFSPAKRWSIGGCFTKVVALSGTEDWLDAFPLQPTQKLPNTFKWHTISIDADVFVCLNSHIRYQVQIEVLVWRCKQWTDLIQSDSGCAFVKTHKLREHFRSSIYSYFSHPTSEITSMLFSCEAQRRGSSN